MIFRRTILSALIIGLLSGLVLSVAQVIMVNPILFSAESYEIEEDHDHGSHDHSAEAWGPEDGAERTFYTVVSNVSAGVGFAALMLALMSQLQVSGISRVNVAKGAAWGLGGFLAFFVAPGVGLPPEIPGINAAAVENRQLWWVFTVMAAGIGLLCLAFAPLKVKPLGLGFIALPYMIHVPHLEGPSFSHPDPAAVQALTDLHQQFIWTSGISNLLFWLALGLSAAVLLNAWVLKQHG